MPLQRFLNWSRVLLLTVIFASLSAGAQAQVVIESVKWNWGVTTASVDVTGVNTSVGSNRALLVALCFNNNDFEVPVSVDLDPGGANDTALDWLDVGDQAASISGGDDGHCTLWGVKSPPSGTTFTVRATINNPTASGEGLNVGVWSLSGVDQTTPFRDAVGVTGGTGTDAASISVPSVSGDLVLAAAWNEWYDSSTRLAVSGTGSEDFDIPGVSSEDKTVGQHKTATGTSTVLTWTNDNNPSPKWAAIGVAVIPFRVALVGSWVAGTTHTAEAGSNRALILVSTRTGWNDIGETITSATYGGQALVRVERVEEDSSSTGYYTQTEAWILDEAGISAASNSTFVVTWSSSSSSISHISAFFENVNQTTLIGAKATNSVRSSPTTVSTSALANSSGDLVMSVSTGEGTGTLAPLNGFTERSDTAFGTCDACYRHSVAEKAATGANETPSTQSTGFNSLSVIGFVLQDVTTDNTPDTFNFTDPTNAGLSTVVEAENYTTTSSLDAVPHIWELKTTTAGYSGTGYMEGTPNSANCIVGTPPTTCGADMTYDFTVTVAGNHYVHFRVDSPSTSDNSFHWGIDGSWLEANNTAVGSWMWDTGGVRTGSLTAATHTLKVWMRESGLNIDQIVINQSATPHVESNIVQVTGMDSGTAISIDGGGLYEYRICTDASCSHRYARVCKHSRDY